MEDLHPPFTVPLLQMLERTMPSISRVGHQCYALYYKGGGRKEQNEEKFVVVLKEKAAAFGRGLQIIFQ